MNRINPLEISDKTVRRMIEGPKRLEKVRFDERDEIRVFDEDKAIREDNRVGFKGGAQVHTYNPKEGLPKKFPPSGEGFFEKGKNKKNLKIITDLKEDDVDEGSSDSSDSDIKPV